MLRHHRADGASRRGVAELKCQGRAGCDGFACLVEQRRRHRLRAEYGVTPFVEVDHLREELGAETMGAACDRIHS